MNLSAKKAEQKHALDRELPPVVSLSIAARQVM
jgi:hypothetical protein